MKGRSRQGGWRARAAVGLLAAAASAAASACPADADLTVRDLMGNWQAEVSATPAVASLVLEPNPEWPGSLAGQISRDGRQARLAGDLENGTFTLEESADGVRIDATWTGQPAEGRCGREIRGLWRATGQDAGQAFILRRVTGW